MALHDPANKLIFDNAGTVADLLRDFAAVGWRRRLDFSTLARLPAEYVGEELDRRSGDMVWRLDFRDGEPLRDGSRPYLAVMLEFQSTVDPRMAWRVFEYGYLFYRRLEREGAFAAQGRLPPVLPVVVYNGERTWTAARELAGRIAAGTPPASPLRYLLVDVRALAGEDLRPDSRLTALIRLESSPAEDLPARLAAAFERFPGEADGGLREGLYARVADSMRGQGGVGELPPLAELERALESRRGARDMTTLMEARIREWRDRCVQEGIEQGIVQGIEQGIERGIEQGIVQGIEEGIERGIVRGRAEARASLLRRLAARRFGTDAAGRLSPLLADLDASALLEVADWIVECDTAAELLARVAGMSAV